MATRLGTFLGGPKEIRPLHLSNEEKRQLKKFLKTLTGEPVRANSCWTCTTDERDAGRYRLSDDRRISLSRGDSAGCLGLR